MFTTDDQEYLIRRLVRNEVTLFLGAGFSVAAKNKDKQQIPTGKQFAEKIWNYLKLPGLYDNTPLQNMFELLLHKGIKKDEIKYFLNTTFDINEFPEYYKAMIIPFWFRIYTTNIDNFIEKIFNSSPYQKIDVLQYPNDEYKSVDKTLEKIQAVYLNGKLPCDPDDLIFARKQYAKNANQLHPLYHQFVNDYVTLPTIFLGTSIDEPIFEQYIAARETRSSNVPEFRPKSFLIDPFISPVKAELLKSLYNIEPINGTTEEFCKWIIDHQSEFGNKIETLKITLPDLAKYYEELSDNAIKDFGKSFTEFLERFSKVNSQGNPRPKQKNYFLGTTPTWNDIYNNLDAPRITTNIIFESIETNITSKKIKLYALLGTAGCGKSTILKRLGLQLSQNGRSVFLTYSESLPNPRSILKAINSLNEKVILLFDNSDLMFNQITNLIETLENCVIPPIIVFSSRINAYEKMNHNQSTIPNIEEIFIPNLIRSEIIAVIQKLEENNVLGKLKGLSHENRISEFENRSQKQILVAMREATKGENFDQIIKSEFEEISPAEAKFLAACVCLTTEAGFTISKQNFISFSESSPAETLSFLERNLSGIVLKVTPKEDRLIFRHRTIAEHIISYCLNVDVLKDVYLRVLKSLAPQININQRNSREFSLYKEIINHYKVFKRFKQNMNHARELYESLIPYFDYDFQFWLQYGSLELEGKDGDLQLAENYLEQAKSIRPKSIYVNNAIANLYYKKAIYSKDLLESSEFLNHANRLMFELLHDPENIDPYTLIIYCQGNYSYIINKFRDNDSKVQEEIEKLCTLGKQLFSKHSTNKQLMHIIDVMDKAYLLTSTNGKKTYPIIYHV